MTNEKDLSAKNELGQVTLIFGKRGKGKTYLAQKLFNKEKKAIVIDFFKEYHGGIVITDLDDFIKKFQDNPDRKYIIQIPDDEANLEILRYVYAAGNIRLYLEEISRYCDKAYVVPELEKFTFWGRHRNVQVVLICQRPAQVNRHILSQADTFFVFQLTDQRDLDYFEAQFDKDTSIKIRNLLEHNFLYLSY